MPVTEAQDRERKPRLSGAADTLADEIRKLFSDFYAVRDVQIPTNSGGETQPQKSFWDGILPYQTPVPNFANRS